MIKKIMRMLYALAIMVCIQHSAYAQMGTAKWTFRDRAAVKTAVLSHLNKPRDTYDILICAGRAGMIGTAFLTYQGLVAKDRWGVSPQIKSAYAFSQYLMLYPQLWDWERERTPGLVAGQWAKVGEMTFFRDSSLSALPKSPEVLLEYALWLKDQNGGRPRALNLVDQAIKIAPRWPELYYWRAFLLDAKSSVLPSKERLTSLPHYGNAMMRALDNAQRLDTAYKSKGLYMRSTAYRYVGKPKESLTAFDAYLQKFPGFATYLNSNGKPDTVARWRAEILKGTL